MAFQGYKFKYVLHASHLNLSHSNQDIHYHNFTLTLIIKSRYEKEMIPFDDICAYVISLLDIYQGEYLGDMELFKNHDTTLEAIGDIFYSYFKDELLAKGFYLLRLEIYESPTRTYSISEQLLDNSVNEINTLPYLNYKRNDKASFDENQGYDFMEQIDEKENKDKSKEKRKDILLKENISPEITSQEKTSQDKSAQGSSQDRLAQEKIDPNERTPEKACLTTVDSKSIDQEHLHKKNRTNTKKKNHLEYYQKVAKLVLSILFFLIVSLIIMYTIKKSGVYPRGSDTFCHIYRANFVLEAIKNGNLYPLYDKSWYNGVEIMRYWAPLPLYLIAFFQYLVNGSAFDGYILFCGFVFFSSACGWLLFGFKYNRMGLATFIGFSWFFLPENMRVLIMDGNLPRGVISILLPLLMYFIWNFLEEKRWNSILFVILITSLIGLCHAGIAGMLLLSIVFYAIIHGIYKRSVMPQLMLIIGMILSFLIIGIWLVPALHGGAVSSGSSMSQVMQAFFQSGFESLNPVERLHGNLEVFYYGISIFLISVLGILLGRRKTAPSFLFSILIFFCTTKSMYSIFINLPFSQFLWMIRFIPIALAFALTSFLLWNGLRKWFIAFLCFLIVIDIIPSYQFIYAKQTQEKEVKTILYEKADALLLNQAKAITKNRLALLDLSTYGAFAPYYISGTTPKVSYTFGAGWEGATTATNIVQLNSAVSGGNYFYLFDRCIEMGNDTVLIRIDCLKNKENDVQSVIEAGQRLGYLLVNEGADSLLFHKDIGYQFGLITKYENIAIGNSAKEIALIFPNFREGNSINLSDYSIKELKQYKRIYLSGFTYDKKEKVERMLRELAKDGVKIIIDMNRVPVDKKTNNHEILGVNSHVITFRDAYPELQYKNKTYRSVEFYNGSIENAENLNTWNTVYLDGIKKVDGYSILENTKAVFAGSVKNDNLYFLGFNLLYHVQTSGDEELEKLLEKIFNEKMTSLPIRKIVPINITYENNKIILKTEYSNVNTTLSYLDIFHSKQKLIEDNNLLTIHKSATIQLKYPYLKEGLFVSLSGSLLLMIYLFATYRYYKERGNKYKGLMKKGDGI